VIPKTPMIDMNDYNPAARRYWYAMVVLGIVTLTYAGGKVIDGGGWFILQVLVSLVVVGLTGMFTVRIPGAKTSIAAAEIFIFLMLLLFGPEAAAIAAAVEGAVGSYRTSKRWTSRIGGPAMAAVAMLICGQLFAQGMALLGTHGTSQLLLSLVLFAALYAAVNSHFVRTLIALKHGEPIDVPGSLRSAGWLAIAYVCSASISGLLFLSFKTFGWTVILVGVPIIGMFLSTLHFYFRQRTIKDEAEAAAQHLEEMRASESRFHSAFTHAAIGMALVSTTGNLLQVNDSLCAMLEMTADELTGRDIKVLAHPDDFGRLLTEVHHLVHDAATPAQIELRLLHKRGQTVWCTLNVSFFSDWSSGSRCLIFQIQDITARRTAETRLHYVAYHDGLTALPNRTHFNVHLDRAIEATQLPAGPGFAVMYLDFDRFKVINDSLGHKAGDAFLKIVATRLQACLRPGDVIARLGGDEFAILLPNLHESFVALDLAARLLASTAAPVQLEQTEVTTSASIGITFSTMGYQSAEDVLRDADIAMYKAKANGKAQYAIFDTTLHEQVSAQLELESELRRAMLHDQLVVHYQPIFSLVHGRLLGFEALVRWNHPDKGMVDPGKFIPIAEEAGLIVALGEVVFEKACQQLRLWDALANDTARTDTPLTMNINVSGVQLAHPGFVDYITTTMARIGVDAAQINIEVTESVLMDAAGVVPVMRRLSDMGIKLSIDDFGTGYSSLSYLHSLPFDTLKIDRSFVERMGDGAKGQAIVRSIVALARALGKSLVAEGIETQEQLAILRDLQCDEGQGYLFSRPLAAEAITPLLTGWTGFVAANETPRPRPGRRLTVVADTISMVG
jgi:diguanylate cyclase (GGDEF)-like protein/PAS domain S-box-containing protein